MAQTKLTPYQTRFLANNIYTLTEKGGTFVVQPDSGTVYAAMPNGHPGDFVRVAAAYLGDGDAFRPEVGMYLASTRLIEGQYMIMKPDQFDVLIGQ